MTYGSANRLATYNGEPVSYDADGNMTIGPLGGNMAASFTCDARSRLTGAGRLTYNYDALDNRIKITDAQGGTTRLVVNPNAVLSQVLMETDAQGNILKYYVYGLGLVSSQEASDYRLYHYNRRGDTIALTNLSGEVTDRMVYDAYGTMVSRTGMTQTPYLFDGRDGVATDTNGLVHMRARYYNPQTMSFTSQDSLLGSIDDIKSLNRYAYAQGNPILFVDPLGHCSEGSGSGIFSIQSLLFSFSDDYDDQYDDWYDKNVQERGRSSDAKKREKRQIDNAWGKDRAAREEKARELHDLKQGGRNDDNQSYNDLKNGNFVDKVSEITGLTGGTLVIYLIISEGSRLIPVRNLVPVP